MYIILEPFVPDHCVALLVSNAFFLTVSYMICFVYDAIESMTVLVLCSMEEHPLFSISSCILLMIVPFKYSISHFNPSISDIIRICGGILVNPGVSSVLFQGWDIPANSIIPLGMSVKVGDTCNRHFSWSLDFKFL